MLIPSIDLQGGRIVQLVQGERLAIESRDVDGWIGKFKEFPAVQLIDLDAARGEGTNDDLLSQICAALPCRVGGGIRSIARARAVLRVGATHVIVGSALFTRDRVDIAFAAALAAAIGPDRILAAVDSRGGRIVVHGWRTQLDITPERAMRMLEPFAGGFLYTNVDREGLMGGADIAAITALKAATSRRLTAAGGISSWEEVRALDNAGIDAVVGMAIYTGRMDPAAR